MSNYPNVLVSKETRNQKIEKIAAIKGMAEKTSEAFVERIPNFMSFIQEIGLAHKIAPVSVSTNVVAVNQENPLYGKTIVMSGFRDAELKNTLKEIGAKVGESVSKNTFILLVKDKNESTSKITEALRLGIPIMTVEEFKQLYI
jgi:NAD-dependent DNA ligase